MFIRESISLPHADVNNIKEGMDIFISGPATAVAAFALTYDEQTYKNQLTNPRVEYILFPD